MGNALKESKTIGLMLEWLDGPYDRLMLTHICKLFKDRNINLITFDLGIKNRTESHRKINHIAKLASEHLIDGLIILSGPIAFKAGREFLIDQISILHPLPMVSVGERVEGIPSVLLDNKKGIFALVEHFVLKHGCKKLAFIAGPKDNSDSKERTEAFKEAHKILGIPLHEDLISIGHFDLDSGKSIAQDLLKIDSFDGLIAANDAMAIGASLALVESGISIPIAGFDDDPHFFDFLPQGLTTMAQPFFEIAKRALEIVLDLSIEKVHALETYVEPELVLRGSCFCTIYNQPKKSKKTTQNKTKEEFMRIFRIEMADIIDENEILMTIQHYLPLLGFNSYLLSIFNETDITLVRRSIFVHDDMSHDTFQEHKVKDVLKGYCSQKEIGVSWIIEEISNDQNPIGIFVIENIPVDKLLFLSEIRRIISSSLQRTYLFRELTSKTNRLKDQLRILEVYTNKSLIKIINKGDDPTSLRPELVERAVLFSDIRNFTDLSSNMPPEEIVELLNSYFNAMNICISNFDGEIDKLVGDCIMAVFEDADKALASSISMRQALFMLNENRRLKFRLNNGIGLHYGTMVAGNIGSQNKMDYTVIGDHVNVASRIESLTKHYGVSILISDDFRRTLKQSYDIRFIDEIHVKGQKTSLKIFEVYDHELLRVKEAKSNLKPKVDSGYELYRNGNFVEASEVFAEIAQILGPHKYIPEVCLDPLINFYEKRARSLAIRKENGLLADWNGIYKFEIK